MSGTEGTAPAPARMIGINHIAIEVGDVEEALAFLSQLFDVRLRGRGEGQAFIDMGDQFLALSEARPADPEAKRHFGLVVNDRTSVMAAARRLGAAAGDNRFRDPWGNLFEIVQYRDVQFTKADAVLAGMGVDGAKTEEAEAQLRKKGLAKQ